MLLLRHKKTTALFILFAALYLAQILLVSPDRATLAKYDITEAKLTLLSLSIALPYIVIWFIGLVGYESLKSYAALIGGSKDGKAFRTITIGTLWLTLWLPLSTLASGVASQLYHSNTGLTEELVIAVNYFNLVLLFLGFWFVNKGSRQLRSLIKSTAPSPSQIATLIFIAFSAFYVFLTLSDPSRRLPDGSTTTATYYQPDWLIVSTIIIPRLIMWFLGIQAVFNIFTYRQKVKGSIYKQSLNNLALGIGAVVGAAIVLRCVQSLSSALSELSLGLLLAIVYVLLVIISIGYVLIAKGADRLRKIEEL